MNDNFGELIGKTNIDAKDAVRAATTANIVLSGTQTVDGVVLLVGDRVLVKNQSTASQNGIYVVATAAWTRSTDADMSSKVTSGLEVRVSEGGQAGTKWYLSTPDPVVLGTTNLTFILGGVQNPWGDGTLSLRPASRATIPSNPNFSGAVWTKVPFQTEINDYMNNYDPVLYRFTVPNTGVYAVSVFILGQNVPASSTFEVKLYANGSELQHLDYRIGTGVNLGLSGTAMVTLGGNDYIEIYLNCSQPIIVIGAYTFFEVTRIA